VLPSVADIDFARLNGRERTILREIAPLAAEGYSYEEIAARLDLGRNGRRIVAEALDELAKTIRAQVGGAELPKLTQAEYELLRDDIAARGQLVPILVDEDGKVLDGHHRKRACDELGIEPETRIVRGLDPAERRALALAANIVRRHLSTRQTRDLIAAELVHTPDASDRSIARRLGVSPSTVASVRSELVTRGLVSNLDTRIGADGVTQPATKPPRHQATTVQAPAETGVREIRIRITEEALAELTVDEWIECDAIRLSAAADGTYELALRGATAFRSVA
jgi:DNA-binding CsgD family transcriptional regulator